MSIHVRPTLEYPTVTAVVEGGLLTVVFEDATTILVKTDLGKPITFRGHPYTIRAEFVFHLEKNTWVPTSYGTGRFQRMDGTYGRRDSSESVAKMLANMCQHLAQIMAEHHAEKLIDASSIAINNKISVLEEKIAGYEGKIAQWQHEIERLNES